MTWSRTTLYSCILTGLIHFIWLAWSWTTFDSTCRAYGPYIYIHLITNNQSKWSRSFCQKCRWQVTSKRTCILRMWLWIKWHRWLMRGCMVCTELAPRRQQFHVARTIHQTALQPIRWLFKTRCVRLQSLNQSSIIIQLVRRRRNNSAIVASVN